MLSKISKLSKTVSRHRFISVVVLAALVGLGFFIKGKVAGSASGDVHYVLAQATNGTLVASVSGSGQVNPSDQVDVKPSVSGTLTSIDVTSGQSVSSGQVIATLDSTDAETAVQTAQNSLNTANYDLQTAQSNYQQAQENASTSLATAYSDGYNSVSTTFFSLSNYMNDLADVLGTQNNSQEYVSGYKLLVGTDSPAIQDLLDNYATAKSMYDQNFSDFLATNQNSSNDTVYSILNETITTSQEISKALGSARHLYDLAVLNQNYENLTIGAQIDKMQPKIQSDVAAIYSNINTLQNDKTTIDNTIKNNPVNIENAKIAMDSAQNTLVQKQNDLANAKSTLEDYTVRAPFSGVMASVTTSVKSGDTISSGTSLGTLVTNQEVADLTLNEVDAAKVKVGQQATLTFDALPNVTVAGKVTEIDAIGTVSQGVVNYGLEVSLDSAPSQVKPGMSVTADIITDTAQNALIVPNGAIKTQGSTNYVEVVNPSEVPQQSSGSSGVVLPQPPTQQTVQIGISNDLSTQILSGLKEGDTVVVSTVTPSQTQAASSQTSSGSLSIPGISGGGGRAIYRGQ